MRKLFLPHGCDQPDWLCQAAVLQPVVVDQLLATMGVREAWVDLLAGSCGGTAVVLVGQPMDTVKVRFKYHVQE